MDLTWNEHCTGRDHNLTGIRVTTAYTKLHNKDDKEITVHNHAAVGCVGLQQCADSAQMEAGTVVLTVG